MTELEIQLEAQCAALKLMLGHVMTVAKRQLSQSKPDTDALVAIGLIAAKARVSTTLGDDLLAKLRVATETLECQQNALITIRDRQHGNVGEKDLQMGIDLIAAALAQIKGEG